jgi:predicted ATP-dependent protease
LQNFWNFKAIPDTNHFDIDSKQTYSEEIQVIPMERFSEVMKNFCFDFGEKYEVTSGWSKRFQI